MEVRTRHSELDNLVVYSSAFDSASRFKGPVPDGVRFPEERSAQVNDQPLDLERASALAGEFDAQLISGDDASLPRYGWFFVLSNGITLSAQTGPHLMCANRETYELCAWWSDNHPDTGEHWVWPEMTRGYKSAREVIDTLVDLTTPVSDNQRKE